MGHGNRCSPLVVFYPLLSDSHKLYHILIYGILFVDIHPDFNNKKLP
jgi:hypothetical protein